MLEQFYAHIQGVSEEFLTKQCVKCQLGDVKVNLINPQTTVTMLSWPT